MKKIDIPALKEFLLRTFPEIKIAYLFGSAKGGVVKDGSDLDIAFLLNKGTSLMIQFDIINELEALLKMPVDVVILNKANSILAFEILKTGTRIIDKNTEDRTMFELKLFRNYLDSTYFLHRRFACGK
jgi:predicted nucleotidyltransferase